jgi:hypothetical protein
VADVEADLIRSDLAPSEEFLGLPGGRVHLFRGGTGEPMLFLMSGGRADSGFVRGIGWEYFGHSINPTRSRARFDEAHDLIIKAWTSPGLFSWYGANCEYRYVNIWPRGVQQPHPPIYLPGAGSTETMKFCAERKYTYMSVYAPARIVRRWFDGYRQAAADLGYVPHPEKIELYAKLGGLGQLIGLFAIGPAAHEQIMHSAELFATEVMTALRPLGTASDAATA